MMKEMPLELGLGNSAFLFCGFAEVLCAFVVVAYKPGTKSKH